MSHVTTSAAKLLRQIFKKPIPIRRTNQREGVSLPLSKLLPTILTTTSTFGDQRAFSSFYFILQRSAARTATQNHSLLSCTVFITTSRNYARGRRMPPKKAVKEDKILLGRPGNNLKSGIVCLLPMEDLTIF